MKNVVRKWFDHKGEYVKLRPVAEGIRLGSPQLELAYMLHVLPS